MAGTLAIVVVPLALFVLQRILSSRPVLRPVTGDTTLHRVAWLASGLLAAGLVLAVPSLRGTLSPSGLLEVDGPWALSAGEVLSRRLDPRLYVAAWTEATRVKPAIVQVPILAGASLFCAMAVTLLVRHGPRAGGWLILAVAPVAMVRVCLVMTIIVLSMYIVHILNFWLLALAIVVIQMMRSTGRSGRTNTQPRTTPPVPATLPGGRS